MPPAVILLSGPSSAGKTSIGRELQNSAEEPFLLFSVDHVISMLPARYVALRAEPGSPAESGLWCDATEHEGAPALVTRAGPVAHQAILAVHRAVAALAGAGFTVIVDDVLLYPAWLDDYLDVLAPFSVLFVGVHCSREELLRRERARGDRAAGNALGDVVSLHDPGIYDLELDTSTRTPRECAGEILKHLEAPRPHGAFACLRARRATA